MFGHDDHKDEDNHENTAVADDTHTINPVQATDSDWQHPGPPPSDDDNGSDSHPTENFTAGHQETPDQPDTADERPDPAPLHSLQPSEPDTDHQTSSDSDSAGNEDLIDLKQEALGKLSPLIGHLDQSPDEKFRTLMMMIQASDDQSLIRQAYETALQIEDEKTRAQALLDIVNEINYFTQNPKSESE